MFRQIHPPRVPACNNNHDHNHNHNTTTTTTTTNNNNNNNNSNNYYVDTDWRIYLHLPRSIQSTAGLNALEPMGANGRAPLNVQIITLLFTFIIQKYINPSVIT